MPKLCGFIAICLVNHAFTFALPGVYSSDKWNMLVGLVYGSF